MNVRPRSTVSVLMATAHADEFKRHRTTWLLSIVVLLAGAAPALATTYYVRKTGNDNHNGQTPATAWKTLSNLDDDTLVAGDLVYIGAGTYSEELELEIPGASGNRIRIVADTTGAMTGDVGDVIVSSLNGDDPVVKIEASHIEINGLKITGGRYGIMVESATDVLIQNCEIYNTGSDGVRLEESTVSVVGCNIHDTGDDGFDMQDNCHLTISNTMIEGCANEGIVANESTSTVTVTSSTITNNGGNGIEFDGVVTGSLTNMLIAGNTGVGIYVNSSGNVVTVWHSTIASNGDDGVDLQRGNLTITNSIVAFNGDDGLTRRNDSTMTHTYNLVYGNSDLQFNGTSLATGEKSADPKFVGGGDYHLQSGSPAIDAGTNGSGATSVDMAGTPRPMGGGWDMGCYEGDVALLFTDVSSATGFAVQTVDDQNMGSAMHWGDLDNDGDLDVIITGNSSSRRLMNSNAGESFAVSTFGGGDVRRQGGLVDLDNDGDLDFWAVAVGNWDTEKYFENDGYAGFTDRGGLGLTSPSNNEGLAIADVNGDGWTDIVMFSEDANWIGHHQGDSPPTLVGTTEASFGLNDLGDYGNGVFVSSADVNGDRHPDFFYHYNGGKLFLSDGDGTYTENSSGISIVTAGGTSTNKASSSWGDYDGDGDMDLFVARYDSGSPGYLWKNTLGVFTNVAAAAGISNTSGQRCGCWGDYDNDGDLDLYVVTRGGNANVLYQNQGNGTFVAVTNAGTAAAGDGQDCKFVDYDNDGDLDLAIVQQGDTNTLLRNNTDDSNFLKVRIVGGGSGKTGLSANNVTVDLYAANETTYLARRTVGAASGYGGTEPMWLHFGGVNPALTYVLKIHLRSGTVTTSVVPATASTIIGGTTLPQTFTYTESAGKLVMKNWGTEAGQRRQTKLRTIRDAVGFVKPVKDISHLSTLDQD